MYTYIHVRVFEQQVHGKLFLSLGVHVQRELMVVVLCACVYVCLSVCYSNICSTAAFWLKIGVFSTITSCFLGYGLVDFAKSVSFKSYGEKTSFLLHWHCRPYDD